MVEQEKFNLAASFQKTIEDILYKKTEIAFEEFEKLNNLKEKVFVVAGGVAANKNIRAMHVNLCKENNYKSWSNKINQVLSDEKNLKITQKHGQDLVFNLYTFHLLLPMCI